MAGLRLACVAAAETACLPAWGDRRQAWPAMLLPAASCLVAFTPQAVGGLAPGESRTIRVQPDDAYGARRAAFVCWQLPALLLKSRPKELQWPHDPRAARRCIRCADSRLCVPPALRAGDSPP